MHIIKGCLVKYFVPWFDGTVIKPGVFTNSDEGKSIPLVNTNHDDVLGYLDLDFREDGIYYTGTISNIDQNKVDDVLQKIALINCRPGLFANRITKSGKEIIKGHIIGATLSIACDQASFLESIDGKDISSWKKKYLEELDKCTNIDHGSSYMDLNKIEDVIELRKDYANVLKKLAKTETKLNKIKYILEKEEI